LYVKRIAFSCHHALRRVDAERPVPYNKPMKQQAGFLNLKGNLFDSAIMKTSVISE
jgi:dihydroxyacid dehydratase/phosphogluconate dehydratase